VTRRQLAAMSSSEEPLQGPPSTVGSWGEPDGEAYGVLADLIASGDVPGFTPLHLPDTIGGAAIAAMLLMPDGEGCCSRMFLIYVLPMELAAFLVTLLQAYVTSFIRTDLVAYDGTCDEGDFILRVICLMVFLVLMVNSGKDIWDIHRWLQRLPRSSRHEMLRMQKFKSTIVEEADKEFGGDTMLVNKVVSGITLFELCLSYLIVISNVGVYVALTWYGPGYILRSADNEALIMNSVALFFVVEMSEYFYKLVANNTMLYSLDSMPPVGLSANESVGVMADLEDAWPGLSMLLLGTLTASIWCGWC